MDSLTVALGGPGLPGLTAVAQAVSFVAAFALGVVFLPRDALAARLAVVALLVSLTYGFQLSMVSWTSNRAIIIAPVDMAWVICVGAFVLLVASRATRAELVAGNLRENSNSHANGSSRGRKDGRGHVDTEAGLLASLLSAASLVLSPRRIGTRWQIPNVAPGPQPGTYAATRLGAALQSLVCFAVSYLAMDVCTLAPPPEPELLAQRREALFSRLDEITTEELAFRTIGTLVFLMNAICGVIMMYNLICFLGLVVGLSTPDACRQFFGSIREAYSLRRFWGSFYHQGLRAAITGLADYLADKVIRLRRGTLLSRYSRLLLAFATSGLIHHMGEIAIQTPPGERTQFVFFSSQALGIMFEDAVIGLYKSSGLKLPRVLERGIGCVWLLFWLVWTVPAWFYSTARQMRPDEDIMLLIPAARWISSVLSS